MQQLAECGLEMGAKRAVGTGRVPSAGWTQAAQACQAGDPVGRLDRSAGALRSLSQSIAAGGAPWSRLPRLGRVVFLLPCVKRPKDAPNPPYIAPHMVPAPRWVCAVALCALLLRQGGAAAAAAAPAAPANGCTLALAAGQHQSFARCALIDHVGNSFHLLWSAEAAGDPTVS